MPSRALQGLLGGTALVAWLFVLLLPVSTADKNDFYAVILDAGSSAMKAYAWTWRVGPKGGVSMPRLLAPNYRSQSPDLRLAAYIDRPTEVKETLDLALEAARAMFPKHSSIHSASPASEARLFLKATGAMRNVPPVKRDALMAQVRLHLKEESKMHFRPEHAFVMAGDEEAAFGWTALSAVLQTAEFGGSFPGIVALEMGYQGTQIAFRPKTPFFENLFPMVVPRELRLTPGEPPEAGDDHRIHRLFAASFQNWGIVSQQQALLDYVVRDAADGATVPFACWPRGHSALAPCAAKHAAGLAAAGTCNVTGSSEPNACLAVTREHMDAAGGGRCTPLPGNSGCWLGAQIPEIPEDQLVVGFAAFGYLALNANLTRAAPEYGPSTANVTRADLTRHVSDVCALSEQQAYDRFNRTGLVTQPKFALTLCARLAYVVALLERYGLSETRPLLLTFQLGDKPATWTLGSVIFDMNGALSPAAVGAPPAHCEGKPSKGRETALAVVAGTMSVLFLGALAFGCVQRRKFREASGDAYKSL